MLRYSMIYGAIIGTVVIAFMVCVLLVVGSDDVWTSQLAGYAIMLAVLVLLFMGIKRYRDQEYGGVITFTKGLAVGASIAAVAAVFYALSWEVYLAATDYAFMAEYSESLRNALTQENLSDAELAAKLAEIDDMEAMYANPLLRLPITFVEIFPVGLIVAVVSAAILRSPKVFPARQRASA